MEARTEPAAAQEPVAYGGAAMANYRYAASPAGLAKPEPARAPASAQGSVAFKTIAMAMGEQHGVDTSTLVATHNSAFPATANADATLQGRKVHFAPGKDTELNIKHEVGHHIINVLRGTPPRADAHVNGQAINTGDEGGAERLMQQPLQRGTGAPLLAAASTAEHANAPIQRTERDAINYISDQDLWRHGHNLYSLMAELYMEGEEAEFDAIYDQLMWNLPEYPEPATDGYDPVTTGDAEMFLSEAVEHLRGLYRSMPVLVRNRVISWNKKVSVSGLDRRTSKSSDGKTKRSKMMNAAGDGLKLYHTKTAPTTNEQPAEGQGKSTYFNSNQSDYFRSSAQNAQRFILGLGDAKNRDGALRRGDAGFVNALDGLYALAGGVTHTPLIKGAVQETFGPFGDLNYAKEPAQGHPGPKLGTEINSATYNLLVKNSAMPTYAPSPEAGVPTSYLDQEDYLEQAQKFVRHPFDIPKDYEPELFHHYRQIVAGAERIYGDAICKLGKYRLQMVRSGKTNGTNFFTYPAVIFEILFPSTVTNALRGSYVKNIKEAILTKWNEVSTVKMTERQSFGFLYPTISDLEKSIRIWPGQYQIKEFLAMLQQVLAPKAEVVPMDEDGAEPKKRRDHMRSGGLPLLQSTLKRSMNLASAAVGQVEDESPTVQVLFNRIASNYGKGLQMLNRWNNWHTDVLFVEAGQIIENLNEAVLHLSTEYNQSQAQQRMDDAVQRHYRPIIAHSGYALDSFYLTHSGQQGSSSSMIYHGATSAFLKKAVKDRGPVYFETMTAKAGNQSLSLVDPSYNFTTIEEVQTFKAHDIGKAHIYDITNMDPADVAVLLRGNPNNKVSLYASFSKHFQFGTDSTNLGFVMHLEKNRTGPVPVSYIPQGAVWDIKLKELSKKAAHVPSVPTQLYHHAALLLDAQTHTQTQTKKIPDRNPKRKREGDEG